MVVLPCKPEGTKTGRLLVARFLLCLGMRACKFCRLLEGCTLQLDGGGLLFGLFAHAAKARRRRGLGNRFV